MLTTYKATLKGNCLEWEDDVPAHLAKEKTVKVYVTIVDEPEIPPVVAGQGQRMAAALEQLAASNALPDVTDPVAWEREIRRDRPLPDRSN